MVLICGGRETALWCLVLRGAIGDHDLRRCQKKHQCWYLHWVKTDLEGKVGFPGQQEWAWIRCCDSPGCIGCGCSGFTQSCFLRGIGLTKAIATHWAGSKQMLLMHEQGCRAVTSSSDGEDDAPHPSLLTLSALQFCSQLSSVWHYKSPLFLWPRLKYLVAYYAKYLLFITTSFCVNAVLSLQYVFNILWMLHVNCFQFSIASSFGYFSVNYCYSCPFVKCVMPVPIFLVSFI